MEGESYHVTPEAVHRFCASEEYNVELIEVSTPELADVIRLEDDYDRTPNISA
jgi:mannose-6-phosphate isomerase-like protein (cupin superfamily)